MTKKDARLDEVLKHLQDEGEDVDEYSLDDERLADGMGDEGDMSQGDEGELP